MRKIGEMERRMAEAYLGCDVWPGLGLRHSTFLLGLLSSLPTAKDFIRIHETNGKIIHMRYPKKKNLNIHHFLLQFFFLLLCWQYK
jgi:hypothetical protein